MASLASFKSALEEAKWPVRLVEKYQDIYGELPLLEDVYINSNTHLGQRKLTLGEVSFYNKIQEPGTIIYTGSASGEHTPMILELFPHLNFLMVDPNYHIMKYDFHYVYKAEGQNQADIALMLRSSKTPRQRYLKELAETLYTKKCIDGTVYDAFNTKKFGYEHFEKLPELSFKETRVLVIQDYISAKLADLIREKIKGPIYHISDIRSTNDDTGILCDNALQVIIQHHL